MNCPNLILGRIKMCDSDLFDGMAPNLSELKKFCESGEYCLCPFYLGCKMLVSESKINQTVSDWNVFHKELASG